MNNPIPNVHKYFGFTDISLHIPQQKKKHDETTCQLPNSSNAEENQIKPNISYRKWIMFFSPLLYVNTQQQKMISMMLSSKF